MLDGGEGVCFEAERRWVLEDLGADVVKDVIMRDNTLGRAWNIIWEEEVSIARLCGIQRSQLGKD